MKQRTGILEGPLQVLHGGPVERRQDRPKTGPKTGGPSGDLARSAGEGWFRSPAGEMEPLPPRALWPVVRAVTDGGRRSRSLRVDMELGKQSVPETVAGSTHALKVPESEQFFKCQTAHQE